MNKVDMELKLKTTKNLKVIILRRSTYFD